MTEAQQCLSKARAARRQGDVHECAALAIRTAGLAAIDEEWETAYHASACAGRLHLQRGEPLEARGWFLVARRAAERHNLQRWKGPALHDLFLCARDSGDEREARRLAAEAWEAYGPHHPRASAFLADLAGLRTPATERRGYFVPFTAPDAPAEDRLPALANLLQVAAARADRRASGALWARLQCAASGEVPGAALCLAHAAESLAHVGLPDAAAAAAERARHLAAARSEGVAVMRAERVLSRTRAPQPAG